MSIRDIMPLVGSIELDLEKGDPPNREEVRALCDHVRHYLTLQTVYVEAPDGSGGGHVTRDTAERLVAAGEAVIKKGP